MENQLKSNSRNVIETILVLLLFLALLFALYDVLKVFFGVLTFALIFSVSFARTYERLAARLKGRRRLAAVIYSLLLIGIIALPFIYIISAMSTHVKVAIQYLEVIRNDGLPPLPDWIVNLPMVGGEIATFWQSLRESPKEVIHLHDHQIRSVLVHVLNRGAGIFGVGLQFIAGIIISAFLLVGGERMLDPVRAALGHLLGERDGNALVDTTGQAVKGVAIGVMGTAFIAAVISFVGLEIAGIPFALGLAALIFFLVVIQIGPLVVWVPLIIYMAAQGHMGMTIFLVIYGAFIVIADALLKPYLIARSGKLPFLVLFLGVIGGLAAWGFTGMFKGAIILAVFYKVFTSWLERKSNVADTGDEALTGA